MGQDRGRETAQLRQRALENLTHQFSPMVFWASNLFILGFFWGLATRWHTCLGPPQLLNVKITERLRIIPTHSVNISEPYGDLYAPCICVRRKTSRYGCVVRETLTKLHII